MEDFTIRPGISPDNALSNLETLKSRLTNLTGSWRGRRDGYIAWVEIAEDQLRHTFLSPAVWQGLLTDRYWHLRALTDSDPRPVPVVGEEADWQSLRIDAAIEDIRRIKDLFDSSAETAVVVLDTSVLMNRDLIDQIKWREVTGAKETLLVLPLIVIDELDDLSFRSNVTSDKARTVLKGLRRLKAETKATRQPGVEVRDGITLRILVDAGERSRNHDTEVLRAVELAAATVGGRAYLATADYGMEVRAVVRKLKVLKVPENVGD